MMRKALAVSEKPPKMRPIVLNSAPRPPPLRSRIANSASAALPARRQA